MSTTKTISGIPGADVTTDAGIIAKEIKVVHADGTTETVYMMEIMPEDNSVIKQHLRDHLIIAYIFIGTLALAFSAYLSFKQLKKS